MSGPTAPRTLRSAKKAAAPPDRSGAVAVTSTTTQPATPSRALTSAEINAARAATLLRTFENNYLPLVEIMASDYMRSCFKKLLKNHQLTLETVHVRNFVTTEEVE